MTCQQIYYTFVASGLFPSKYCRLYPGFGMLIGRLWGHFSHLGAGFSKYVTSAEAILSKMNLDEKIGRNLTTGYVMGPEPLHKL
jgi:hypothetical protein